jgi:hypothetical protein
MLLMTHDDDDLLDELHEVFRAQDPVPPAVLRVARAAFAARAAAMKREPPSRRAGAPRPPSPDEADVDLS